MTLYRACSFQSFGVMETLPNSYWGTWGGDQWDDSEKCDLVYVTSLSSLSSLWESSKVGRISAVYAAEDVKVK